LSIEAFTDNSRFPVVWRVKPDVAQDVKVTIYDLATPKHIGQMLSVGLPANPGAARILAEQSIKANRNSLTSELKSAYQVHTKAMDYGLTHYPALVFNGKAVIYGINDVEEGIKRYQTWQAAQRR
jgi:integrating conjugative element protein (TIGR03757 family)